VENAPELLDGLELYWLAYAELSTCRPLSMSGVSPIPWTALAQYAQFHALDYDQFCDLVYFARELDTEYKKWADKRDTKAPISSGGK
jgi:hypothetical protein